MNRTEHSRKILYEKNAEKYRRRFVQDADFLCAPRFVNNLPCIPCGPFFQKSPLPHELKDFSTYVVSNIEKQYIWKPHLGVDGGVQIDPVDLTSKVPQKKSDQKLLRFDKGNRRLELDEENMPNWLRAVPQTQNDLYRPVIVHTTKDLLNNQRDQMNDLPGDTGPFPLSSVEQSFTLVKSTLEESQKKKGVEIDWEVSLFPYENNFIDTADVAEPIQPLCDADLTILQFDEDPAILLSDKNPLPSSAALACIGTDICVVGGESARNKSYLMSLFVPETLSPIPTVKEDAIYVWLRDYRMDYSRSVGPTVHEGSANGRASAPVLLHLDIENKSALLRDGVVQFSMKRMPVSNSADFVKRRRVRRVVPGECTQSQSSVEETVPESHMEAQQLTHNGGGQAAGNSEDEVDVAPTQSVRGDSGLQQGVEGGHAESDDDDVDFW